ncbi:MAG: hypothetical protein IJ563_12400, partial [Selenomonadaceae bacterium]|nr:hypothetical protein [Selenomonadaceae bacterium]
NAFRDIKKICERYSVKKIITFGNADKGYVSKEFEKSLKEQGKILLALKRKNAKDNFTKELRQIIFKIRRRIETTFSQLTCQLNKSIGKKFLWSYYEIDGQILSI